MPRLITVILTALCLGLSACSTTPQDEIVEKTLAHTINISVVDAHSFDFISQATCTFLGSDNRQLYKTNKNPEQIILPSWEDHVYLACQASDYYQEQIAIANTLDNWVYDDLGFLPSNIVIFDPYAPKFDAKYIIVFMSRNPQLSQQEAQRTFSQTQKADPLFQGKLR